MSATTPQLWTILSLSNRPITGPTPLERGRIRMKRTGINTHLLISVSQEVKDEFILGYQEDPYFKDQYTEEATSPKKVLMPSHFQNGCNSLLYFVDADWKNWLCIPRLKIQFILRWIHESPHESTYATPFKFLNRLWELFFWTTLTKDTDEFASTCDVCQKIKVDH
jgi:hypothetical protein